MNYCFVIYNVLFFIALCFVLNQRIFLLTSFLFRSTQSFAFVFIEIYFSEI